MKIKSLKFIEESNVKVIYELTYFNLWNRQKVINVCLDKFCDNFAKNLETGFDCPRSSYVAELIKHQYQIEKGITWQETKKEYWK